jgi:hypothetical protein
LIGVMYFHGHVELIERETSRHGSSFFNRSNDSAPSVMSAVGFFSSCRVLSLQRRRSGAKRRTSGVAASNPSWRIIYLIYKVYFDTFGRRFLREIARSFSKPRAADRTVRAHQQQVVSVAAASRLGRQLEEVIASLSKVDARFALIGGLARASHKVIRATQDIDLLADSEKAEDIDRELVAIGYQCLHRSPNAGNYLRGDERVDFIYARRPAARRLLSNAAAPNCFRRSARRQPRGIDWVEAAALRQQYAPHSGSGGYQGPHRRESAR